MKHLQQFLFVLLFGVAASCSGQSGGFQRTAIPDNTGFARPMAAFTVDIPAGWQARGEVSWGAGAACDAAFPTIKWQARSPDGSSVLEILPRWASQVPSAMGPALRGCPVMAIASVRALLEHLATQRHPGAQLLDYRERPDLLDRVVVPEAMNIPNGGSQNRNWAEAGEVLVGWNENGRSMRETISVSGVMMQTQVDMPMTGPVRSLVLVTGTPLALSAPNGQLDFTLLTHMRGSLQETPDWSAQMHKHTMAMMGISAKGSRDRGQIAIDTIKTVSAIHNQTWETTQTSQDGSYDRTIDGIRGVQPYADPNRDGPVDLDNTYDHAWRLQDGSYYQTNDPNFNPYLELGVEGEELNRYEQ